MLQQLATTRRVPEIPRQPMRFQVVVTGNDTPLDPSGAGRKGVAPFIGDRSCAGRRIRELRGLPATRAHTMDRRDMRALDLSVGPGRIGTPRLLVFMRLILRVHFLIRLDGPV